MIKIPVERSMEPLVPGDLVALATTPDELLGVVQAVGRRVHVQKTMTDRTRPKVQSYAPAALVRHCSGIRVRREAAFDAHRRPIREGDRLSLVGELGIAQLVMAVTARVHPVPSGRPRRGALILVALDAGGSRFVRGEQVVVVKVVSVA